MKKGLLFEMARKFAIYRLTRIGKISSKDICAATECSKPTALAVLDQVVDESGERTQRIKTTIFLKEIPPVWCSIATDDQFFEALVNGANPKDTGLFPNELPVVFHHWTKGRPIKGLLFQITSCLTSPTLKGRPNHRSAMRIRYVSMNIGEESRWRTVVPIGLDCAFDQWRLIAHDLDVSGYPVKTYVLYRINAFEKYVDPLPPDFRRDRLSKTQSRLAININPALTHDQHTAISNELGIDDEGYIMADSRTEFEYLRKYGSIPPSEKAIWPIVTKIGDKKCT
ncbi:MAG: hypothetical protein KGI54_01680 [Pseudomonadota bacterium]|nr:hypothetical protein [Pseudomonadota bacterium]